MKTMRNSKKTTSHSYTIGRRGFAKISEVEGIKMPASMDEDFTSFEQRGLSAEERRKIIAKKYGKVKQT